MKKRNRSHRENLKSNINSWFTAFGRPTKRDRRSWMFEHLEERNYFTASPLSGLQGLETYTVSNSTAEGQQLVDALAQLWAMQSSSHNPNGELNAQVLSAPTDPAFQYQWHLFNVGQIVNIGQFQDLRGLPGEDINVVPVWDSGITGQGVRVAVVDNGVQLNHPDLAQNISTQYAYNALNPSANAGPTGTSAEAAHGTAVAGLIGAVANNNQGGVGVAYGATIIPIKLIPTGIDPTPLTEDAFVRAINANGAPIDIYNHSWGPVDAGAGTPFSNRGVDALTMPQLIALTNSARLGRNGLGAIHVFAAGNGAEFYDSAGSNGYVNSRYTIAVGIVDHDGHYLNSDGTSTGYGEMAPSVLIVAPSASGPTDIIHNFDTGSGIFTTDLTNGGLNVVPPPGGFDTDTDGYGDGNYTSTFGGTSAAAPLVSGVIALMLEANPNLTYRDVEEILVRSARQSDDLDPSWITNYISLFRDPLRPIDEEVNDGYEFEVVPGEGEEEATVARIPPGYHPIFDPRVTPLPNYLYTNGAGYTVSYGRRPENATEYGYAHGVVDAGLAVQLARQWHLKEQNLPAEKTWIAGAIGSIKIRGAQVSNEESGEFLVPGGLSQATEGFIDYFNEFFKEPTVQEGEEGEEPTIDPDSLPFAGDDPPVNTRGLPVIIDVPAIDPVTGGSNLMSIEWVEVKLNVTGGADPINNLRITLVSPDGTHSELTQNQFRGEDIDKAFQRGSLPVTLFVGSALGESITPADENGTNSDTLDWVYSTNRHWGERSDSNNGVGWQLYFENYSATDLDLNGVAIAFHGTPIGSPGGPVERVSGKVGEDGGRYLVLTNEIVGADDGAFNFSRSVPTNPMNFEDAFLYPAGTKPDPQQESFAGNVNVYAIDNATGQRVAEFLTGADGNYYFDLPAGEYTIGIEDPLGRTALADGLDYDSEWIVVVDTSDLATRTAAVDKNFLLDPGSLPPEEVIVKGQVIADLDGDGTQDAVDTGVSNFTVYADLNHTGQFESGEPFALTDFNGNYSLTVSTGTPNTFTIGVRLPTGWLPTSPASGFHNEYALPGETIDNMRFLIVPPSTPSGEGPGTIFGFIYSDKNGNGVQDPNETGLAGRTVFIDANTNGKLDAGETTAITTSSGAYQFGEVGVGTKQIDVVVNEPFVLTAPVAGFRSVTLVAGQVSTGNSFGIRNLAISDFGDLNGSGYRTKEATSIVSPGFSLGSQVDTEIRPQNLKVDPLSDPLNPTYIDDPTKHGIGDDQVENEANFDDEDGVVLVGGFLRPGGNLLTITVNGVGGYLQGWIDFDKSGTFDLNEQVLTNEDINPGTHQFVVNAPVTLESGSIAARFRWGTNNQTFFSSDSIGEIEDYLFVSKVPIAGDFNADNVVDNADFLLWKSTHGSNQDLRADGNHNGVVDFGDYSIWRDNLGSVAPSGGGGGSVASAPEEYSTFAASGQVELPPALSLTEREIGGLNGSISTPLPAALSQTPKLSNSTVAVNPPVSAGLILVDSAGVETETRLGLANVSFSTMVSSVGSGSSVRTSTGSAEAEIDAMLLLLAPGLDNSASSVDSQSGRSGLEWSLEWGKDEGGQDADLELAVNAAFDDETDWWLAL